MVRSIMSIRGHERFVTKPLAVTTNLGRTPSVLEQQRRAILLMREEEASRIKTEEEFKANFLDFSHITGVDEFGLPLSTPYAVPDSVPDVYVPQVPQAKEENSVSKAGSDSEPAGGTE